MNPGSQVKDTGESIAHVIFRDLTLDVAQHHPEGSRRGNKIVFDGGGESRGRTASHKNTGAIHVMHAAALNSYVLVRTAGIFCPDPDPAAFVHLTMGLHPVYRTGGARAVENARQPRARGSTCLVPACAVYGDVRDVYRVSVLDKHLSGDRLARDAGHSSCQTTTGHRDHDLVLVAVGNAL